MDRNAASVTAAAAMPRPRNHAQPAELYGVPVKEIARICSVDLTTARRWKRGTRCPPKSALLLVSGDLGVFDPTWSGWVARRGRLISPEGWEIPVNQVRAFPLVMNQLAGYQTEYRRARGQVSMTSDLLLPESQSPPTSQLRLDAIERRSVGEPLQSAGAVQEHMAFNDSLPRQMATPPVMPKGEEGLPAIKAQTRTGRPRRLAPADEWQLFCCRKAGASIKSCASLLRVSVPTANRIIAKFREYDERAEPIGREFRERLSALRSSAVASISDDSARRRKPDRNQKIRSLEISRG